MKIEYFFLLFGLIICGNGIYIYILRLGAEKWARASGVIVYSTIRRTFVRRYSEEFECCYRFTVNGKEYEDGRLAAGGAVSWSLSFPGLSSAQRSADEYPKGKSVTVYYDPDNPERNALEQGDKRVGIVLTVLGLFVISASLAVAFWQ